jgi:hypothetical protein
MSIILTVRPSRIELKHTQDGYKTWGLYVFKVRTDDVGKTNPILKNPSVVTIIHVLNDLINYFKISEVLC